MLVRDLMTPEPSTLERNQGLMIADEIMQMARVRHLPVLDEEGAIAGILSQRDLFRSTLARVLGYGTHAQDKLMESLRAAGYDPYLRTVNKADGKLVYRVWIGFFADRPAAAAFARDQQDRLGEAIPVKR